MSYDGRFVAAAALGGVAAGVAAFTLMGRASGERRRDDEDAGRTSGSMAKVVRQTSGAVSASSGIVSVENQRSKRAGMIARWTKPVVISGKGNQELAATVRKKLGSEEFAESSGPTICMERFKSDDPNMKFNWQRVVGRKVVFIFDTVDQSVLFEQLALLQALQGFAVPDAEDAHGKWKTYVNAGTYSWGRASHITVVLPWYRHCQMERTSRWHLKDSKWTNDNPNGEWLDVPTALYFARLLSTPGSVPPLPGPADSLDGMPIDPLWRPPLELLFIELHEEVPISHAVSDLGATIRMERFVPYFLDKFKAKKAYPGRANFYVLFPDHGAHNRYAASVDKVLKLDFDHILYIQKTRVGDSIDQVQKLFFEEGDGKAPGEKLKFAETDEVLIIDDFTNSGSTLFGAVNLVQKMSEGGSLAVSIFVSHLVATYDPKTVESMKKKVHDLGPKCKLFTTNTIPVTTDLLKGDPQIEVLDLSDFIADLVS